MPGTLFLHIGRNKAGSTALRASWLRQVAALQAAGIQYALFGQTNPLDVDLPNFSSHLDLIAYIETHPAQSVLVSNEGLCCFHEDFARVMAEALSKLNVHLLFYVRSYTSWAVSDYTFNVLIGEETRDFDEYLSALGERASFWPALKIWGDALGWDRVRVRSIHPDDLFGGDLATDGLAALGLAYLDHKPATIENSSPAWISTEIIRAILKDAAPQQIPTARFTLADILSLGEWIDLQVRIAASKLEITLDQGVYVARDQALRLERLYNADLDLVSSQTGIALKRDDMANYKGRSFLPSVESVPIEILNFIARSLVQESIPKNLENVLSSANLNRIFNRIF